MNQQQTLAQAVRQSIVLWVSLLLLGGLTFFALRTPAAREWMWSYTGEEAFGAQVKGLTDLASDLLRPRPILATDVPVLHGGGEEIDVSSFGINVFLEQEADPAKRELAVAMAADAGYRWLRQEFPWEDIEIHGKGDFEDRRHDPHRSAWEKYDHLVDVAHQNGLELIVRISNPPSWARAGGDEVGTYAPPDDFQDYADFVEAVVSRYRGRVRYYQLWNEPNIYPEWGNRTIDPEAYVELLKVGAGAARAADPDAIIIAGALASTIDLDGTVNAGRNFNDLLFLQRMYDAGAAPYFDIMAMQGYGLWSGPTDHRMHPRVINFGRPQFVRDVMVRNGDADTPIWISEMNWNAVPDEIPDKRYGQVSLEQQARYLPLAYTRVIEEWPWVGVANTWYLKRATDTWEQNRQPEAFFRLLAPDFTPQPVYETMKRFTSEFSGESNGSLGPE